MSELYRTFAPELEVRSAAKGGDGRTIVGIAVPYEREQRINSRLVESFARGAFGHQLRAGHRIPFTRDHLAHGGTLIGKTLGLRDDAAGLYGEWRVSRTPAGDETLELIKDGALQQLSVGFREVHSGNRRLPNGTIQRTKADLIEVDVVLEGAYGDGAVVTGTRSAEPAPCPACGGAGGSVVDSTQRLRQAERLVASLPVLGIAG